MKKALTGSSSGSGYAIYDTGLSMISEDLPDKIMKWTTTKINSSDQKNMGGNFLKENGVSIGQRRQQIIQKSYEENAIEEQVEDNFETTSPMKISGKGNEKKNLILKIRNFLDYYFFLSTFFCVYCGDFFSSYLHIKIYIFYFQEKVVVKTEKNPSKKLVVRMDLKLWLL